MGSKCGPLEAQRNPFLSKPLTSIGAYGRAIRHWMKNAQSSPAYFFIELNLT